MDDPHDEKESIVSRLAPSQRTVTVVVLVLLSLGVGVAGAQLSGTLIDDFEDGDIGGWDGATQMAEATSDNPIVGAYSMEVSDQVNGGQISNAIVQNDNVPTEPDTIQAYVRWSYFDTYSASSPPYHDGVGYGGNPAGEESIKIAVDGSGTAYAPSPQGEEIGDLQTDTIYLFQMYDIDYSSETFSASIIRASDGAPVGEVENVNFGDSVEDDVLVVPATGNTRFFIDDIYADGDLVGSGYEVNGTVTNDADNPIDNATIVAEQGGSEEANVSTDFNGNYIMRLENGTYNITASADGYFPRTVENVTIDGEGVTQDFQLTNKSDALEIDVRPFIEHGQTVPYDVIASPVNETTGDRDRFEVTDDSLVTSGDTNVVTLNSIVNEVTATSDRSVNNRTYLQATWTNPETGDTISTRANVTVANKTVDNLGILPAWTSFSAVIGGGTDDNPGDRTFLLILIGTALAAAVSRIATSLAGLGALTSIMLMGWILGMTNDGLAIVTVLTAMFIGMNVAGNVDYQVRH